MSRKTGSQVFQAVLAEAERQIGLSAKAGAGAFKHAGIQGDERAAALATFLRSHLPKGLGVLKGELVDFRDGRSGQIDIVIYDEARAAPFYTGEENVLLPCEMAIAAIEVKTTLRSSEIQAAYASGLKLRALRPFDAPFLGPRQGGAPAGDGAHRLMYLVFAFQSDLQVAGWGPKELSRVKSAAKKASADVDVIERIVVLDRGIINTGASMYKDSDGARGIFLDFYVHLMNFVERERSRRPLLDLDLYSRTLTKGGWKKA